VAAPLSEAEIAAIRGPWAGREGQLDAPFWSTPPDLVEQMLDLAGVGAADYLIDLGCGDGRVAIAAGRRGARALGVDLDPARIGEAKAAAREGGVERRVRFRAEDLFATPLGKASVVTLYLLPHVHALLHGRLLAQLRPGSRVVSHAFPIADWAPAAQEMVERRSLYLWTIPAPAGAQAGIG
jgi:SAM-dependent methyltransferase